MISRSRLIIANIAGVLVICFFIAAGAYFYYEKSNFIKTEDAVVAADMMPVVAPAPGVLASWNIQEGVDVSDKSIVGGVSDGTKTIPVSSRMKGKIIKNDARAGQPVQAGQVLAQEADMDHLYIIANIKENRLKDIKIGQSVDVTVDATRAPNSKAWSKRSDMRPIRCFRSFRSRARRSAIRK
ncbi:multidrug resistance protein MdtN [Paenibacillus sp. P1XP2]|nr:multidrug resistance protein MdtN [Paenibacillus sp. P1XP2]